MTDDTDKHDGVRGLMDKATDAIGGMVGLASASTAGSHDTSAFITNAAIGDLYEVEAGAIALERADSPEVREFAAMMLSHHMTSRHQLQSALRMNETQESGSPAELPTALDTRRQSMIEHLRTAPAEDFDNRYLTQQRLAHRETLTLLSGFGESGTNPQLSSYARGGTPMVRRHIKMIDQIEGAASAS